MTHRTLPSWPPALSPALWRPGLEMQVRAFRQAPIRRQLHSDPEVAGMEATFSRCNIDGLPGVASHASVAAVMTDRSSIAAAAQRLAQRVRHTPVLQIDGKDLSCRGPVKLKLELLQHTGSFKPRGAFNR